MPLHCRKFATAATNMPTESIGSSQPHQIENRLRKNARGPGSRLPTRGVSFSGEDGSVNLLALDVKMAGPSALHTYRVAGLGIFPHDRPTQLTALTVAAFWLARLRDLLLDGALHHRSRDNGEDESHNKNQGHEASDSSGVAGLSDLHNLARLAGSFHRDRPAQ